MYVVAQLPLETGVFLWIAPVVIFSGLVFVAWQILARLRANKR